MWVGFHLWGTRSSDSHGLGPQSHTHHSNHSSSHFYPVIPDFALPLHSLSTLSTTSLINLGPPFFHSLVRPPYASRPALTVCIHIVGRCPLPDTVFFSLPTGTSSLHNPYSRLPHQRLLLIILVPSLQSRLVLMMIYSLVWLHTTTKQSSTRSTTPAAANNNNNNMDPDQNDQPLRNDHFTVDLDGDDFPEVFHLAGHNLQLRSFSEDSPPRGQSSDLEDNQRRRASPRSSPMVSQPPMPLYPDQQRERLFDAALPAASPPSTTRRAPESQYSYFPDNADWYSPPPLDPAGMLLGEALQRSPILLSSPVRSRTDSVQHTPSRPFPFEASPGRDTYDSLSLNTPQGTHHFSPVNYQESARLGLEAEYGASRGLDRKPSTRGAPTPSPLGFLKDVAPSPHTDNRRAAGPYGRYPYHPPYHYPGHSVSQSGNLQSSPVAGQSDARPRRLWGHDHRHANHPAAAAGSGMRIELGGKAKLDDINKMMRAQSTPSSHRAPSRHHHHPGQPYPYHPHYYQHMHRSSRMPPPHPHPPSHHASSSTKSSTPTPLAPATDARFPFRTTESKQASPETTSERGPIAEVKLMDTSKSKIQPTGKENAELDSSQKKTRKRSPCNCKKSRCLKLYCECFSAELYCEGCNCRDCCNTAEHEQLRERAIKETRSKNPKAFKPRLHVDSENSAQSAHNMGCRCKKSECLKKYCECFQAGVFCAGKCKCKSCSNFAGSQKLIDKRRKMKDLRGAEIAMRAAQEVWQNQSSREARTPQHGPSSTSPVVSRHTPGMMMASVSPHTGGTQIAPRAPYPSFIPNPSKMTFSPLGTQPVTPGHTSAMQYRQSDFQAPRTTNQGPLSTTKRTANKITPTLPPRTPAVRLQFDPASSRKKRRKGNEAEATFPYFGPGAPEQPKTTALAVFSFLSNEDVYNAALVCKTWKTLAEDGELWQFS